MKSEFFSRGQFSETMKRKAFSLLKARKFSWQNCKYGSRAIQFYTTTLIGVICFPPSTSKKKQVSMWIRRVTFQCHAETAGIYDRGTSLKALVHIFYCIASMSLQPSLHLSSVQNEITMGTNNKMLHDMLQPNIYTYTAKLQQHTTRQSPCVIWNEIPVFCSILDKQHHKSRNYSLRTFCSAYSAK